MRYWWSHFSFLLLLMLLLVAGCRSEQAASSDGGSRSIIENGGSSGVGAFGGGSEGAYGVCVDPYIPPEDLEEYDSDWIEYDECKLKDAGEPQVALSVGSTTFVVTNDLDEVHVVEGPQGGYHIWLAFRVKNVAQKSSVKITGTLPSDGTELYSIWWSQGVFFYSPILEACERTSVTYVIDEFVALPAVLGNQIQFHIEIIDAHDGTVIEDEKLVNVAPDIL